MKKFILFLVLLCFITSFSYQGTLANEETKNSGVKFEELSLVETLAKAVNENKLVMIDVYSHG